MTKRPFFRAFLARQPKGQAYLDLGCGSGGTMRVIQESDETARVFGADIVNSVRHEALRDKVRVLDLSRDALPFADASFDVVTAIQVMEHLENPFLFAREAARVLKPGGSFILSFPSGESVWARVQYLVSNNITGFNTVNNHITFLTRDVFAKTFLVNFTREDVRYDGGFVPYVPGVKLPASKWFSKRVCYFLRKK